MEGYFYLFIDAVHFMDGTKWETISVMPLIPVR